jgi:hypothetical protein
MTQPNCMPARRLIFHWGMWPMWRKTHEAGDCQ